MPRLLRRWILQLNLRQHFWVALALGILFRFLCAWFVYGPQALDDYKHGVFPAYQWAVGLTVDLPDYRSFLLVWLLGGFVRLAGLLGVQTALGQVRAMYLGLGVVSLSGIYGTYLYVRGIKGILFPALALYVVALFPLMPFVGTRAFGEAVAMSLVLLAFGYLEGTPRSGRTTALGFLFLGLATLFRFHVGIINITYLFILLVDRQRRNLLIGLCLGVLVAAGQGLIDILSGKGPLQTLWVYLLENEGGGAKYGVSPWYNPWLFVLLVAWAPFSFVLLRSWGTLWRRQRRILIPWLMFVAVHSFVAHKEERFMYPVLGLELWAVTLLWASNAFFASARRIFAYTWISVCLVALLVVCFINTQAGEIEPPARLQSEFNKVLYLDYESLFGASRHQAFFLRPPSVFEKIEAEEIRPDRIDQGFIAHNELQAVAVLTSDATALGALRMLAGLVTQFGECRNVIESGSLLDRIIYHLNPKHNERRRPTWYVVCERK